jgi:hypothetical protein
MDFEVALDADFLLPKLFLFPSGVLPEQDHLRQLRDSRDDEKPLSKVAAGVIERSRKVFVRLAKGNPCFEWFVRSGQGLQRWLHRDEGVLPEVYGLTKMTGT